MLAPSDSLNLQAPASDSHNSQYQIQNITDKAMAGVLPWHKAKQVDKIGERGDVRALKRLLDEDTRTSLTSIESRRAFRTLTFTAIASGHTAMVKHLCEERNVAVHKLPGNDVSPETLLLMPRRMQETYFCMTPLGAAIASKHEDLALYLLALPDQDLDLQLTMERGYSVLHLACSVGLLRVVQALLALGAQLEARDENGDLPLCIAACDGYIPVVGCLLERYRDLGPAKLQEALDLPCQQGKLCSPLLVHAARADSDSPSGTQASMLRYLVQEWKADVWQRFGYNGNEGFLSLHVAAIQGRISALEFYFTECEMPVDTLTEGMKHSPLQIVCLLNESEEALVLPVVKWLVETKHADKSLRDTAGRTAADIALQSGMEKVAAYLSSGEREVKAKIAEEELLSMLDAEEGGLKKKRQRKQKKTSKKKQDNTGRTEGTGEEIEAQGEEMGKGSCVHVPDSQEVHDSKAKGGRWEGNQREQQFEAKSGVSGTAATGLTAGLKGLTLEDVKVQMDKVDEERAFLLQDVSEEFVCPLTHELLTDPVVAACGYSYQRTAFEKWVAQCRADGLQLTSPKTGAPMESHMLINRLLKQQVEEYKEARLQAWRRQREESRAGGGATEEGGGKGEGGSQCG